MKNLGIYVTASLIKIILGFTLLIIDFTTISIKEDTAIALIIGLIGIFLTLRGVSYFLFYWTQRLFITKISKERLQKDAYKCSFLFGLYALVNILLIIAELRNKWIGLIGLILFILMQYIIFSDPKRKENGKFTE